MIKNNLLAVFLMAVSSLSYAADKAVMVVWANEAIVSTYTFDYKNFLERQKVIAKYFTSEGWKAYSQALLKSQLFQSIEKNKYDVTSVATLPPEIKQIDASNWQATMPVLVLYKNPQYQQKQYLDVVITFTASEQGVRGYAITSLQSKATSEPCACQPETENSPSS